MTAQQIIDALCVPMGQRASAWTSRRNDTERCTTHAGFAGYPFADDGYDFMARATGQDDVVLGPLITSPVPRGLRPWPEVGDWPYIVYLRSDSERAIVSYCEGDLAVAIYDDVAAYVQAEIRLLAAESDR